jgi:hypothetical protein
MSEEHSAEEIDGRIMAIKQTGSGNKSHKAYGKAETKG